MSKQLTDKEHCLWNLDRAIALLRVDGSRFMIDQDLINAKKWLFKILSPTL